MIIKIRVREELLRDPKEVMDELLRFVSHTNTL